MIAAYIFFHAPMMCMFIATLLWPQKMWYVWAAALFFTVKLVA
jgi:hypothetical protein